MRRHLGLGVSVPALLVMLAIGVSGCAGTSTSATVASSAATTESSVADLGTLIEAEDAAIYAYGVIGAHLTGPDRARALKALSEHRRLRDDWIGLAHADGQEIPPAAIAYDLPIDVRDRASAEALSVEIETRMIRVYDTSGEIAAKALSKARARLSSSAATG